MTKMVAKTKLGEALLKMRAEAEARGEPLLDWDEIRAYKDGWLDEARELKALRADNERLRGLLRRWMDQRMSPWPPSGELVSLINATSVALGAADQPAAAPRDPDAELREFAGFLTAYLPELHAFEVPRMLDAIVAFRAADNAPNTPEKPPQK